MFWKRLSIVIVLLILICMLSFGASEKTVEAQGFHNPPITGVNATDAHDGKIDVSWNSRTINDFKYYAIYVSDSEIIDIIGLSPIIKIMIADQDVNIYQISGLKDNTEYWFAVTVGYITGHEDQMVTSMSATPTPSPGLPVGIIMIIVLASLAVIGGLVWLFLRIRSGIEKGSNDEDITQVKYVSPDGMSGSSAPDMTSGSSAPKNTHPIIEPPEEWDPYHLYHEPEPGDKTPADMPYTAPEEEETPSSTEEETSSQEISHHPQMSRS